MEIDDVVTVTSDIPVLQAFGKVVRSRRTVLLVHVGDKNHLYSAEALHAGAKLSPDTTVGQLEQIIDTSDLLLSGEIELLDTIGDRVRIRVNSPAMFTSMNLAVGIHKCSDQPVHSYYDWELKTLSKDQIGNYLCDVDNTIVR
jgi:hypothetical protein